MLMPFVQGGLGLPVLLDFLSNQEVSGTNATSYTFSSKSLGTYDEVIVGIGAHTTVTTPTISSVTVGGSGASAVATKLYNSGGQTTVASFYRVARPGSTGDVVVDWGSDTMTSCGIGLWGMKNAAPGTHATATDERSGTDQDLSASIGCPAGGAILSLITVSKSGASATWTNLSEKWDEALDVTEYFSGASDTFGSKQTSRTITADVGVDMDRGAMLIASFSP